MTVLWYGSRVPIPGSHRRSLWGHSVRYLSYLLPTITGIGIPICIFLFPTQSVLLFYTCCLAGGDTKLLMELHLWAQICRAAINITRLPRRADTPLKAVPQGLWAAGEIIHAAATWNYEQRLETACTVLTQCGWLCLTAAQQTSWCMCITNTVERLLHSFSRAESYSKCQTGYSETKALERCQVPVSPSRATKLLPEHTSCRQACGRSQRRREFSTFQWLTCESSPPRQSYWTKLFAAVGIANGHLQGLLLMIHLAKERIFKADNYASLELWNFQLLLLLLLFSSLT